MQRLMTDRPIYKIRKRQYGDAEFPIKVKPLEDELLSSWLIRTALEHKTAPATFTNLYIPETKNKLWSSDIDMHASDGLLAALSFKSALPLEQLRSMTLKAYEGFLFEKLHANTGGTQFINPLGLRGRRSKLPGLRYCPYCLNEDLVPYFRKKWRLAFSVVCLKHKCYLLDRCLECGTPIMPYLSCNRGKLGNCYKCEQSILSGKFAVYVDNSDILNSVSALYSTLDKGFILISGQPVSSHLYFQILHQILKLMMSPRYGQNMQNALDFELPDISNLRTFEALPAAIQSQLLNKALWLLDKWPERFIEVCCQEKVFSSELLRDLKQAPFWYWEVVVRLLYHPDRVVSENEFREAIKYMESQGVTILEGTLSNWLGVSQVFRKRHIKLEDLM